MNFHDLIRLYNEGTLKINFNGHFLADTDPVYHAKAVKRIFERLTGTYNHLIEYANGKGDGTWNRDKRDNDRTDEQWNADMREHYNRDLVRDFSKWSLRGGDLRCDACGCPLYIWSTGPDSVEIRDSWDIEAPITPCAFPDIIPYGGTINITSDMVVGNYFRGVDNDFIADCPEDEKWEDEWSLNYYGGCRKRTEWKAANQNIAYGQMGNMSICVYMKKDGSRVIISDSGWYDSGEDCSAPKGIDVKNYIQYGHISLAVWRYEVTDMNTLGVTDFAKFQDEQSEEYVDVHAIPVKHGKWKFTHYFDLKEREEGSNHIYADFVLTEE
jgi:hypothetical protein